MKRDLVLVVSLMLATSCSSRAEYGDPTPTPGPTPPGSWTALTALPAARQETGVVALEGEIYVLGGFNGAQQVVDTVEAFDPGTGLWRAAADLPVTMHHANAAVVNGTIVVAGFLTGGGSVADGRVFSYDPATDAWTEKTSMPAGAERGASGTTAIGSRVWVVGGYRGGSVADVHVYDAAAGTAGAWSVATSLPEPLDHLVAAAVGGTVFAIGGRDGAINAHTARVDAISTTAGAWSSRAPMPTSRGGAAAASLPDGRVCVFGGEGNSAAANGVFDDAECYDPAADAWTVFVPMATPRHGTGAAAIGSRLYVPGGADVAGLGAVNTNEVFDAD